MSRAISPRSPRICSAQLRRLPSFPTRRSSDLAGGFNGEAETAVDFRKGYDPEKVKAYELGLKSRWLDQRLQVNVATFYNQETDLQLSVFTGDGSSASSIVDNAGKSVKSGAEIEVIFQPTADLQLSANYGYLDARYKKYME